MPGPDTTLDAETRASLPRVAAGIRQAAKEAGVPLPLDYARSIAATGLSYCPQLGVTPCGKGVIVCTMPEGTKELPVLLGFANAEGQWYRNGSRYQAPAPNAEMSGRSIEL